MLEASRNFEQALLRAKHRRDPVAFFKYVGMRLARVIHEPQDYQKDVLLSKAPRVQLVAGRQCGKTTTLAALALHTALFSKGSLVLLVTPTERQARILFARVARMYQAYGGMVDTLSARRMGFEFENDSQIEALPGNAAGIQGYDASLVIVDEGGFVSDELFDAITPSLAATGGRLVFAGRPNGQVGPFYDVWVRGAGSWEQHLIRADESPLISPEHLAAERARMTEREYAAQYLCSFEEAEGQVFRSDLIETAFTDDVWPLWEDFSTDGVASHLQDEERRWVRAEDLILGRPKRTLEDIEKDVRRALCGAPGFDADAIIKEYRDAQREQEVQGGR